MRGPCLESSRQVAGKMYLRADARLEAGVLSLSKVKQFLPEALDVSRLAKVCYACLPPTTPVVLQSPCFSTDCFILGA
jgi:hypothetical protein